MTSYGKELFVNKLHTNSGNLKTDVVKADELQCPVQDGQPYQFNVTYNSGSGFSVVDAGTIDCAGLSADSYVDIKEAASLRFREGGTLDGNTTTATVCTNLDLRASSNIFPSSFSEILSRLDTLDASFNSLEARVSTLEDPSGGGV